MYLEDPDKEVTLDLGPDMRKINFCFFLLKVQTLSDLCVYVCVCVCVSVCLYSIKTITPMESPHKDVCACLFVCVCVCVCVFLFILHCVDQQV